MLTSFEQVRDWIIDNGFKRWALWRDRSKQELIIDSAGFAVADLEDKIAMTEKYLRFAGGNAYAAGSVTGSQEKLNVVTEIRLSDTQQPVNGVQNTQDIVAIGQAMEERIRKQLKAEIEAEQYEKEKREFEAEKKEFEEQRNGVIGALVGYVAPYLPIIKNLQGAGRMVAGIDADEPVHAKRIQPIIATDPEQPEQQQEPDVFTDEESEELFDLMARFKKAEPENWLKMLRTVVDMAESGDQTYTMAKGFLIK